jgi:methyl-accepting chemotaxis protein
LILRSQSYLHGNNKQLHRHRGDYLSKRNESMFQRISQRLGALIVAAIVGLLLTGGNGVLQLQQVAALLIDVTDNALPSIVLLEEAKSSYMDARAYVLYHVAETDTPAMEKRQAQLNDALAKTRAALKRYEPLIVDDEDRQALNAVQKAIDAYADALTRLLTISSQLDKDAALIYLRETQSPLEVKAIEAFQAHFAYNLRYADNIKHRADDTISQARMVIVGASLAIIGFLLWMAYGTYQMIVGTANRACEDVSRVVRDLDFSRPLEVTGKDELSDLLRALNQLIERLRDGLSTVRDNAERLVSSSAELAGASSQVRTGSGAQSDAASSMAASVEEMTVSINQVSDHTSKASALSHDTGEQAEGGRNAVGNIAARVGGISHLVDEAVQELERLEESGRQISTVVAVIKDVADQTNLLALNAAIEAARAGEQGRGFAVVADEVRKLAERVAVSTGEISSMVNTIQMRSGEVAKRMNEAAQSVRDGVGEADVASAAMNRIADTAGRSRSLVSEIADALREQGAASNTIAGQVEQVAQMAQGNSLSADRSAELADELKNLANGMQQTVAAYRLR